jgi:hypothetical protein
LLNKGKRARLNREIRDRFIAITNEGLVYQDIDISDNLRKYEISYQDVSFMKKSIWVRGYRNTIDLLNQSNLSKLYIGEIQFNTILTQISSVSIDFVLFINI